MKTLDYYELNAEAFVTQTQMLPFAGVQNRFLMKLPQGGHILDFGCGSGRDTRCFLKQGFQVTATDGSEKMCRLASEFTGIPVKHMRFQDLDDKDVYDGIWACASILHLHKDELPDVLARMRDALKNRGLIYTSFKYGDYEGVRNGRYFTDFSKDAFKDFLGKLECAEVVIEEEWITSDARPGRSEEKWLNIILRKTEVY